MRGLPPGGKALLVQHSGSPTCWPTRHRPCTPEPSLPAPQTRSSLHQCPLLGRPSLTPGTLRWSVFSFVLCPSTGLSSMRTSSPHLAPYCTPSSIARSQSALSTHLRAGRSTSGLMVVRTSHKALSQPPGAFPPPCPCTSAEGNRCSQILVPEIPP